MNPELFIMMLLVTKHFVIDGLLQTKFQYENKGEYGHLGGILHAFLHGIGTILCFNGLDTETLVTLALVDIVIHYHIDYFKTNIVTFNGWSSKETSHNVPILIIYDNAYFVMIVLDQCLHMLTYVGLIWLAFNW